MGVAWWLDLPEGTVDPVQEEGQRLPRGAFKARYNSGSCKRCGSMVLRGEVVRYNRSRSGFRYLTHLVCPVTRSPRVKSTDNRAPRWPRHDDGV